ncbi:glycosyltransferase family 2 protein [Pelagovum pacificum]|uniref:Glycosyltransferase family 2 protein n=1 Tax=Pelagovum pacificum TaxID=2588711 RepID=A0A5C5GAV1_9RHOB|nr:glycosyltransferase family 2 protein [Pelagovum pacificum]QQA41266.1 glycosyltransferase family 2 protein [Pelagovum pacificum]TNY31925.1 glycosyltransferase family 2 protein [Pelagovum pacificum]
MRITSITPMKNEAPYILEWVAYHRLIGINDILVFSNDCTDGTDQMLERLDELGLLRHYPNPSMTNQSEKHHREVINYINSSARLGRSDWVVHFDVDEFICVNAGQGRITDLFDAVGDANMICMSQHNFGSSGKVAYEDGLTTEAFKWSADKSGKYQRHLNRRGVKTLTHRSAQAKRWNNHSPVFRRPKLDLVRPVNGSGEPLPEDTDLTRDVKFLVSPHYGYDLVQLNHYAIRAVENFVCKMDRGDANFSDFGNWVGYWEKYDHNDLLNDRIDRHIPDLRDAVVELRKDPELKRLHDRAVAHSKRRVAELREDPGFGELLERIEIVRADKAPTG